MATQTGSISFESQGGFQSYASGQYATLAQVKGQFATCSTAAGTQAKAATIVPTDSGWALYTGATITVKFTTANTHATPTLNVNSTGAKSIRDHTGAVLTEDAYKWAAGTAMSFTYDGTYWRLQDTLPQRVTTAETAIEQTANNVLIKATETDTTAAQGGQHLIQSLINVAPSGVTIDADKVNIVGVITAINDDTTTTIDGGKITAHSLTLGEFSVATQEALADYAKTATNYIAADSTGVKIASANPDTATTYQHQTATTTTYYVSGNKRAEVSADGLETFDGNYGSEVSTAKFGGTEARIGKASTSHVLIKPSTFGMMYNEDRLVEVNATGQLTSIYVGGSTAASGVPYTDSFIEQLTDYLNNGCTVSTSGEVTKILDPSGNDTHLTIQTASGPTQYAVIDSSDTIIESASYASIQYDSALATHFYLNVKLYPLVELPGTPVHAEISKVTIDMEDGQASIDSEGTTIVAQGESSTLYAGLRVISDDTTASSNYVYANVTSEYRAYLQGDGKLKLYVPDLTWYNGWYGYGDESISAHVKGSSDSTTTKVKLDSGGAGSTTITPHAINLDVDGAVYGIDIGTTSGVRGIKTDYDTSSVSFGVGSAGANHGVYSNTQSKWIAHSDGTDCYLGGMCFTHGSVGQSISAAANAVTTYPSSGYVSFGHTYASAPDVVVGFFSTSTAAGFGGLTIAVSEVTTTGFKVKIFNNTSTARTPGFHWIAIG